MGVQIQALCLCQAELLAGSSSESPFPSAETGLRTVDFGTSTGWELEVRNSSFNTLRAAAVLGAH